MREITLALALVRKRIAAMWTLRNLLVAYLAVAIATFGWAASTPRICAGSNYPASACAAAQLAIVGFVAGAAWPLYWSWKLAEAVRQDAP